MTAEDYCETVEDEGVVVHRFGPFPRRPSLSEDSMAVLRRRIFRGMEIEAREFCPDIAIAFYVAHAGLLGRYVAQSLGIPLVLGVRGNDVGTNMFHIQWLPILSYVVSASAQIVCVNQHLQERTVLAFPAAGDKTIVIENGVELPRGVKPSVGRPYLRSKTDWPASVCVAVFIGTLREKKGLRNLIPAMLDAANEGTVRLLLVGPEPSASELGELSSSWKQLTKGNLVHVTGQRGRDEALRIASEGDLIVVPSIEDGLANGLLEGMALGLCPVVSSLFSSVVTHGETGLVFPMGSTPALASQLRQAAANCEARKRYGDAARKRTNEHFTADGEASAYLKLFRRLLTKDRAALAV